ncbi:hypothetical protein GWI33_011967 [Rhynchophorus ferrugineus]|uniref:Uncharacterized protein n=1 Tax=Rhynchophorus ferrugineus TaxID=354439 RepID=A0A834MIZ5_RHYFE|nr:hypothetical protein GWI33_011967 [Rhynchophorus ferrugineus]
MSCVAVGLRLSGLISLGKKNNKKLSPVFDLKMNPILPDRGARFDSFAPWDRPAGRAVNSSDQGSNGETKGRSKAHMPSVADDG